MNLLEGKIALVTGCGNPKGMGRAMALKLGEQGATVIRIESQLRPDFLRMLHLTAENRNEADVLDRAPMFVLLNPDKQSVSLNMMSPGVQE